MGLHEGKEASILWSHHEETKEFTWRKRLCKEKCLVHAEEDYIWLR